jgi:hypothetical protein
MRKHSTDVNFIKLFHPFLNYGKIYPNATIANAPGALCESDCHQIKDLGHLLFSKWEISTATRLDKFF